MTFKEDAADDQEARPARAAASSSSSATAPRTQPAGAASSSSSSAAPHRRIFRAFRARDPVTGEWGPGRRRVPSSVPYRHQRPDGAGDTEALSCRAKVLMQQVESHNKKFPNGKVWTRAVEVEGVECPPIDPADGPLKGIADRYRRDAAWHPPGH